MACRSNVVLNEALARLSNVDYLTFSRQELMAGWYIGRCERMGIQDGLTCEGHTGTRSCIPLPWIARLDGPMCNRCLLAAGQEKSRKSRLETNR